MDATLPGDLVAGRHVRGPAHRTERGAGGSTTRLPGLLSNRPLTKLLLGEFISGIGDWLYIVAIFVVIYRETSDAAIVGLFGAVRLVPYIVLSVPAGVIADRFDRRLVLLFSDLLRGGVMVLMTVLVATNGRLSRSSSSRWSRPAARRSSTRRWRPTCRASPRTSDSSARRTARRRASAT